MRSLFILTFLANVALAAMSPFILPAKVAIHFGRGGYPDSWASSEFHALIFIALHVPLFLLFLYMPPLVLKLPSKIVSLPNKDYWLAENNRHLVKGMLSGLMFEYGFALFAFLLGVSILTIQANLSDPVRLNEGIFFVILTVFMLYTIYWCVKIFSAFKVPSQH